MGTRNKSLLGIKKSNDQPSLNVDLLGGKK